MKQMFIKLIQDICPDLPKEEVKKEARILETMIINKLVKLKGRIINQK